MERPTLARQSVPADVFEFASAELEAFVAMSRCTRPQAWARVETLQAVCRAESPATADGLQASVEALGELDEAKEAPRVMCLPELRCIPAVWLTL